MGNNNEIRQRMETCRKVLLTLVWIGAVAGMIGGIVMISYETGGGWYSSAPLRPYGIGLLIVSILGGIIGHFFVNVALAIPFILLNNGDYLAAIVPEGKVIKSALSSDTQNKGNENAGTQNLVTGEYYEVTANTFIRSSPYNDAPTEKQLISSEKVVLKNESTDNPGWFFVTTSDGKEGWVNSGYLKKC